jgi:ABC-type multidrug transport system fused ATPase/permease subunit
VVGVEPEDGRKGWRRRAAGVTAPWRSPRVLLLRQLPAVSPGLTVGAVAFVATSALLPLAATIASGTLVGRIPAAVRDGLDGLDGRSGRALLSALGVVALVYVAQFTLAPLLNQAVNALGRRLDRHLSNRVMAAILAPTGIRHLEDPAILDEVNKAEGLVTGYTPGGAVRGMAAMWSARLGGVGGAVLIAGFRWWLALLLVATAIGEQRYWRRRYDEVTASLFDRGDLHRRSSYLRDAVLTPVAAKEVRVFGLQPWFASRFHAAWAEVMAPVWKDMRGSRWGGAAAALLPTLVIGGALAVVADAALAGHLDLRAVVILGQAVLTTSNLGSVGDMDDLVARGVAALPVALDLVARLEGPDFVAGGDVPVDGRPHDVIRFEGVGFRYPGRDTDVYRDLDLEIRAGRSLAIVGANGAGKTTLVKLLARMYEPTSGRITVDGVDVRHLDAVEWQRRIAAIFQDFRHYHLSARDNVAFGAPELEGAAADAALERAAGRAGVLDLVASLDAGWDTPLDRQRTGGTDLSGGQWQRIALARALYAVEGGAGILVLDEPTASLDVRTESELYERFLDLTAGCTTIVISHRFSTVRRADRIVVLDGGRVAEAGTHDELVALGGTYATMFALQASRYVEDEDEDEGEDEDDEEEVVVGG